MCSSMFICCCTFKCLILGLLKEAYGEAESSEKIDTVVCDFYTYLKTKLSLSFLHKVNSWVDVFKRSCILIRPLFAFHHS